MRAWPDKGTQEIYSQIYPEVDAHSLYTHVCMRMISAMVGDAVDQYLETHDMSSGRFIVLMNLEQTADGAKPSKLATDIGVTQATITGLIDGLEKTGYVKRKDHHEDGRACVVTLTERGRKFITSERPAFNRWVGELYSAWTPEEQKQAIALFEKLATKVRPAPCPQN